MSSGQNKEKRQASGLGAEAGPPSKTARTQDRAAKAAAQASAPQAPAAKAAEGSATGETTSAPSITETPPSSLSKILDQMAEAADQQEQHLAKWVEKTKVAVDAKLLRFLRLHQAQVPFPIPAFVLDLVPLAITAAASGSMLAGFREVMNYTNLHLSFEKTALYEAAGTIWMLNPVGDLRSDSISISQLESAMQLWSEEAFRSSATQPVARRYSFDVPLPAKVVDSKVAQRKEKCQDTVVFAQPVPLLAGRAVVIAWYGAMSEALERAASGAGQDDVRDLEHRVFKLFEAALSVPIRLRLNPDPDNCRLLSLRYSEQAFAAMGASGADSFWKFAEKVGGLGAFKKTASLSIPKALAALKLAGLSFKGKVITEQSLKALRALAPYVEDARCSAAFSMLECVSPEFRETTLLMRLAQLSSTRVASGQHPQANAAQMSFVFVLDCLRIGRLAGDVKQEDVYTVSTVSGQERQTPALVHMLFKKQDLVEFVFHEAWLVSESLVQAVAPCRTPLGIWQKFETPVGEQSLVAAIRKGVSAPGEGLESQFALRVAEFRDQDQHDTKAQTLIDLLWGVWCSTFDDEFMELCSKDMKDPAPSAFLWHRYLLDSKEGLGSKYRAFTAACTSGPIPAAPGADLFMGTSHLGDAEKEDLLRVSETIKTLRRKTVGFVPLPAVGGCSGADFSRGQLEKLWEGMRLGHRFNRKKGNVRAFVLSSELFPPNVAKQATTANLSEPIASDADRMKRVIEFIASKRAKDDLVILFDGRSRPCRKVMEAAEDKLAASGAHAMVELFIVFTHPAKNEDPRAPGRQTNFAHNTKEVAMCSLAAKSGLAKLVQRSEFNSCGESATSATTYTGVPMRRFDELPRMDADSKASILGAAAAGAVAGKRLSQNIAEKGHPFSHCEVKPLNLWQRICEHHGVTHIVDFSPGSAGLAIAATGAMEYEGVASNEIHCRWLDSTLDLVVKYLASKDKVFANKLGGDDDFAEKVAQYFAGTLLEARRYLEPEAKETPEDEDDGESSEEDGDGQE